METNQQPQNADELRKAGKYREAIPIYQQMIETSSSSYPTRWLIHCLRKSGKLEEAYQTAQEALQQFPQDPYLCSEMAWVIYDRDIKPGKAEGNIGKVINASKRALELDPDNDFLVKIVSNTVMKTAKGANNTNWKIVAEFAEKINPEILSKEKRKSSDGKFFMSEKEDWFLNTARAFYEIGDYQKAIDIATAGLKDFPNEFFLTRTIALAQFGSGDSKSAEETMRPLINHPRSSWYIRSELARILISLGKNEEAYRLFCQALQNNQDPKYKVKDLENFAELCLQMSKFEEAFTILAFIREIRTKEGWSVPDTLLQLEQNCRNSFEKSNTPLPDLPSEKRKLAQLCQSILKSGGVEGMERFRGIVTGVRSDRKYAFIRPSEGEISPIVFERDLPKECAVDGTPVEYSLEKSFDAKKNRESFKAVHVIKVQEK